MAIKWEDYNLPSFKLGYDRSQPVPFKKEVPYAGNAYIRNCNSSLADLPVTWDVTIQLTNQQADDFNVFLDDFYGQSELLFEKTMYTEVGPNVQEMTIIGSRPQPVSSAHNLWTYQFTVYSGELKLQTTPVPDPPVIPPYPGPGTTPDNFIFMPPEFLNTGGLNSGDGDRIWSLSAGYYSNRALVATYLGRAAYTSDGGETWVQLPRYMNSGAESEASDLVGVSTDISGDGSTIIAGFDLGYASISKSYGQVFFPLTRGLGVTDGEFYSIESICSTSGGVGVSTQMILAIFSHGRMSLSQNQGGTFLELPYRLNDDTSSLQNYVSVMGTLNSTSSTPILIADSTFNGSKSGYVYISMDNGQTWEEYDHLGFNSTARATSVSLSRNQYAQVAVVTFEDMIAISTNRMLSWFEAPLPNLDPGETITSSSVDRYDENILITTSFGKIFNSTNNGQSWDLVDDLSSDIGGGNINNSEYSDNFWMVTNSFAGFISSPNFEQPEEQYPVGQAPTTWSQLAPRYLNSGQTGGAGGFIDVSPDGQYMVYTSSAGTGSQSANGGLNFTKISELGFGIESQIPGGLRSEAVCMSDDGQRIYVVCRSGYAGRTIDGGDTWEEMPRGLNMSDSTEDIDTISCSADGMTVFAGGLNGNAAISYNGGDTWVEVLVSPGIMLSSAMSVDGQFIVSVHYAGGITISEDAFATTAGVKLSIGGNNVNITDVCCDETGDTILLTKANGEAHLSVDRGNNWSELTPLWLNTGNTVATDFHCAMSYDGNVMLVGAGDGYFAYSDDGGANWNQLPQHLNSGGTTNVTDITTNGQDWIAVFQAGYVAISRG